MRPLIPIPISAVQSMVGHTVHVQGWNRGCVFRLTALSNGKAVLKTPKTGREYIVPMASLAYIREDEPSQ